jgi:salicylate hydroxylase
MFFTFIFPLVQLFFAVDGYVSCIRGRTPEEITALIRQQKDLDISDWKFSSGEDMVLPPFGKMYWYIGTRKEETPKGTSSGVESQV